jgi:hypothetical protein
VETLLNWLVVCPFPAHEGEFVKQVSSTAASTSSTNYLLLLFIGYVLARVGHSGRNSVVSRVSYMTVMPT